MKAPSIVYDCWLLTNYGWTWGLDGWTALILHTLNLDPFFLTRGNLFYLFFRVAVVKLVVAHLILLHG